MRYNLIEIIMVARHQIEIPKSQYTTQFIYTLAGCPHIRLNK